MHGGPCYNDAGNDAEGSSQGLIETQRTRRVLSTLGSLLILGVLAALVISAVWNSGGPTAAVGHPAPNFNLAGIDSDNIQLEDFEGQVVMLNFWATWCEPCRAEMPAMQRVYERYRDEGFVILAINFLETEGQVKRFLESVGATFPVAYDITGGVSDMYLVRGFPTSVFIDRDGIVHSHFSTELTEEAIEQQVKALLQL